MNKVKARVSLTLTLLAAGLLVISLRLPLWHMKMEAPQYQGNEALRVRIFPGAMRGDLREIRVLNQYIGVRIPDTLPQLQWLPVALVCGAGLGLLTALLPPAARCWSLMAVATLVSLTLLGSATLAQWQMYDVGHHRNAHAALKGVENFTPPILGKVKIANFEIQTGLAPGAYLIGLAIAFQVAAGCILRQGKSSACCVCGHAFGAHPIAKPAETPA